MCILLALKQAFEVDKPLGDATRGADFTMEVIWHNIPLLSYFINNLKFNSLH